MMPSPADVWSAIVCLPQLALGTHLYIWVDWGNLKLNGSNLPYVAHTDDRCRGFSRVLSTNYFGQRSLTWVFWPSCPHFHCPCLHTQHTHSGTYTHTQKNTHTRIHTNIRTQTHTSPQTYTHALIYTQAHKHTHTHSYTHKHTNILTRTHIHTSTQTYTQAHEHTSPLVHTFAVHSSDKADANQTFLVSALALHGCPIKI